MSAARAAGRAGWAALLVLLAAAALIGGSPASAASSCPTQTYLQFNHIAYAAVSIPASVRVPAGSGLGSSSAVTVGLLHALLAYQGRMVSAEELAERACTIEIERCRKPKSAL